MLEFDIDDRRHRLEAAFRKLSFPKDRELHLRIGLQSLSLVDSEGSGVMPVKYRFKQVGRPRDVRADAVATITGHTYFMLTGKKPTLTIPVNSDVLTPRGPFFELLTEVFRVLELKQNPEHFAKHIARDFKVPTKE
jgi:hypothetical protein